MLTNTAYLQKQDLRQQGLEEQQTLEFAQLPLDVKKQIVELEKAFFLMSVQRLPSKLLINSSGYKPARQLSTPNLATEATRFACLFRITL